MQSFESNSNAKVLIFRWLNNLEFSRTLRPSYQFISKFLVSSEIDLINKLLFITSSVLYSLKYVNVKTLVQCMIFIYKCFFKSGWSHYFENYGSKKLSSVKCLIIYFAKICFLTFLFLLPINFWILASRIK